MQAIIVILKTVFFQRYEMTEFERSTMMIIFSNLVYFVFLSGKIEVSLQEAKNFPLYLIRSKERRIGDFLGPSPISLAPRL